MSCPHPKHQGPAIWAECPPTSASRKKKQEEILARLNACSPKDKETALRLLSVCLQSLAD